MDCTFEAYCNLPERVLKQRADSGAEEDRDRLCCVSVVGTHHFFSHIYSYYFVNWLNMHCLAKFHSFFFVSNTSFCLNVKYNSCWNWYYDPINFLLTFMNSFDIKQWKLNIFLLKISVSVKMQKFIIFNISSFINYNF